MKVQLTTHDGMDIQVEIEDYNAEEINAKLNSHELNTIVIGDVVISRINVKSILPINN